MRSVQPTHPSTDLLTPLIAFQSEYELRTTLVERKRKGQFFTPNEICRFMAGFFNLSDRTAFRLLDPGAGVGSLSAGVCERVRQMDSPMTLEIHLFENDNSVLPFLRKTMEHCGSSLTEGGHTLSYHIHEKDFILDAAVDVFGQPNLFAAANEIGAFDGVIVNPPTLQTE